LLSIPLQANVLKLRSEIQKTKKNKGRESKMPRNRIFKNNWEMLHAEAYALFLWLDSMPHVSLKLKRRAQARSARRFSIAYSGK